MSKKRDSSEASTEDLTELLSTDSGYTTEESSADSSRCATKCAQTSN